MFNAKLLVGGAALVLATSALAGGPEQAPAAPAPVASNSCFYVSAGWNAGLAVGYHFNNVRLEVAGDYLRHSVQSRFNNLNVFGANFSIQPLQIATVMANAYYDFDFGSSFVPYVGAGLGWAHSWESIRITNLPAPIANNTTNFNTNNFAFQGIVGLDYKITDNVRVGVSYHALGWTNSNRRNNNVLANPTLISKNSFENQINLGVSYFF
jgi:opacity protein-like surface antigen